MFLVIVDTHSKWPEVAEMSTTAVLKKIEVLRWLFCHYGLPDHIVSPNFTSKEYTVFLKQNGVKHTCSAPYHPATN